MVVIVVVFGVVVDRYDVTFLSFFLTGFFLTLVFGLQLTLDVLSRIKRN